MENTLQSSTLGLLNIYIRWRIYRVLFGVWDQLRIACEVRPKSTVLASRREDDEWSDVVGNTDPRYGAQEGDSVVIIPIIVVRIFGVSPRLIAAFGVKRVRFRMCRVMRCSSESRKNPKVSSNSLQSVRSSPRVFTTARSSRIWNPVIRLTSHGYVYGPRVRKPQINFDLQVSTT